MSVEVILSIVIAICTVFYTIINLMLWFESRANRKQNIAPQLVVFLKSTENHTALGLHVKNIGKGLARNVKIKTLKDYKQFGQDNISELGIIKNGFNIFPPQYELKYYINSMIEIHNNDENEIISFELTYESSDKRKFKEFFHLPFNQILGENYSKPPETYMGQIPYYLKEINKTLKKTEK